MSGVNWGLLNPAQGFDYLDSLQQIGEARTREVSNQATQYKLQEAQRIQQARPQIAQRAQGGDFQGAQQQAMAGGDFDYADALGKMDEATLKRAGEEAGIFASVAHNLRQLPPEQRAQTLQSYIPSLKATGHFSDEELAAAAADLSDGRLDGAIATGMSLKERIDQQLRTAAQAETARHNTVMEGKPKWQFDSESGSWLQEPGTGGGYTGPSAVPQGGTGRAGGAIGAVQQQMAESLSGVGLPPAVVAGFMGNFEAEGGYTGAQGDGGTAGGVAQWRGERRENFKRVIGKDPTAASMQEQAAFVKWELDNPRAAGMTVGQRDAILSARSPEEAASLIDRHYERSSGAHRERRVEAARRFAGGGQAAQQQAGPGVIPVRPPKSKSAPSGYQYNQDGTRLVPIPGGPADPAVAGGRNPSANRKAEADFRKEFNSLPEVKTFNKARPQFQTLRRLAIKPNPSAADDIALIFAYMKTLDPESVVRETEYATAQNSGGIPENIRNAYNKARDGTRLTAQQRLDFAKTAQESYLSLRRAYNQQAEAYRGYAQDNGINPERVARRVIPDRDRRAPKPIMSPERRRQFRVIR